VIDLASGVATLTWDGLSGRELAAKLGFAPSTLNRVLTGASDVSPEMASLVSKRTIATGRRRLTGNRPGAIFLLGARG